MMKMINIVWVLLNIAATIFLYLLTKRINAKKFKVEVLDTKVKAIQKRLENERHELEELSQTLQEQKMVLNQKWDQIQEANQLLDARALKLDEERKGLAAQQEELTAKKIEIEQQEVKLEQTMQQLKEKWQQHRNEIRAEREQLVNEFERINEAIRYLESLESKVKLENQKADKEKSYLAEQFKALENAKRDLEQKSQQLQEKEKQLNEAAQQQREERDRLEREREKLFQWQQSLEHQIAEQKIVKGSKTSAHPKSEVPNNDLRQDQVAPSSPRISIPRPDEAMEKNIAERWHWVGNLLRDDGRPDELLFGKTLPRIIDQQRWADVDGIVIGEQVDGTDQLLWQLRPNRSEMELDLNALEQQQKINILTQSHNTQFFLAAYDKDQRLIGFQTFRFMAQLHDIDVEHPPLLPGPEGHRPTQIRFAHEPGCQIRPLTPDESGIIARKESDETIAIIPPHPELDATNWEIIDSQGRKIEICIRLHRIWWSLMSNQDSMTQTMLSSQPLEIPWGQIHSGKLTGLAIWLPVAHGLQQIYVGLTKQKRKAFQLQPEDRQILVSLDGWIKSTELAQFSQRVSIQLWLDKRTQESTEIAYILPAPWQCRAPDCQFRTFDRTDFRDHIKDHHFDFYFRQAEYSEIRDHRDLNLPAQIYQCGYCHQYIATKADEANPVNVIIHHILGCTEANQLNGAPVIQFRIVTNSDEIRRHVIPNLPRFYKCNLCQKLFEHQDRDQMLDHLLSSHESAILESNDLTTTQPKSENAFQQPASV
ncbi:MAG: hypothetical protein ONB32_00690 [candidate division KSB1 bacterium]|nr:hypothetical protein [candidate division KSB1 bacterium]